ncbi:MAG TPA: SdrD B-like domain-containing protein [Plantibacter sp.]|uniref:SdrD B-like domain-containing protein n=1 Tax=Plantibacter sp. TaxID=1871045 RepID=UPI002BFCF712|nr:SdrD B-like domain-containing protein [Plantibacter sp.]
MTTPGSKTRPPSTVGLDNVTKVRVRPVNDQLPARAGISLWAQLQAKEGIEVGAPITQTYSIKSSGNGPDRASSTEWVESGWWHGVYRAAAGNNAFPRGDQLIASTAAVSVAKRAVSPATEPGAPTPIAAGSEIGFELRPQILTPDAAANAAAGVVVTDFLPAGFTFDAESATPEAATVEMQADGSTLIEWQLGTVRRGAEPVIAYRASASPFTVGQFLNRVIVSSPDDPTSLTAFPEEQGHQNAHYAYQTILVSSPSGLQLDKTVDRPVVEAGDPVGYHVSFANMSAEQLQHDVRLIDVLPFPGDARGSTAQGALAGAPASEAVLRYTAAPGSEVSEHVSADETSDFGQLPEGFDWCASDAFGSVGCPESFGDVTAIEATVGELPPFSPVSIDYELVTDQSAADARFVNDAVIHSATQALGARSPVVAAQLVSSAIGERVWWDLDGNGLDDDGPDGTRGTGVERVELELSGTDKHGTAVTRSTTTDADGRYEFARLISGDYQIDVRPPDGMRAQPTVQGVGDDPLMNSAIDPESMAMSGIVIEDPSPTAADGQDLRWNGGLVPSEPDEVPGPGSPGEPEASTGHGGSGALAVTGAGFVTGALLLGALLVLAGLLAVSLRRTRRLIGS